MGGSVFYFGDYHKGCISLGIIDYLDNSFQLAGIIIIFLISFSFVAKGFLRDY